MIRNYLKIAFRNLWRQRVFSGINILGLAVGMAACFLIFLYVRFELSYDKFHSKADRIYRLATDVITPSETIHAGITSWAFGPNIKADFPDVAAVVRINQTEMLVRKGDVKFQEDKVLFADSTFFQVFDFGLEKGDAAALLRNPFSVVLSESAARKYFGTADPVGQSLLLTGQDHVATITGVMKDLPANSQIEADMLVSMSTLTQRMNKGLDEQWSNFGATTYLLLQPGADATGLEKKFPLFLERRNGKEMKENQMYYTLFLDPMKDVYLQSDRDDGMEHGNASNVYTFSIIAVFILLIACINFVNLTTARSTERAKEVGIRKVVGAERGQLMRQFIGESLMLAIIAYGLALVLAMLLLPLFNQLAGKTISTGIFSEGSAILLLLAAAISIGILAGTYPALVLSSFRPIAVLKGRFATGNRGSVLRKGLVVTQFAISIALIIGTIVVYRQMSFMRNRNLGFTKDQMLILDTYGDPSKRALQQEIAALPQVKATSLASSVPGGVNSAAYSMVENYKGDMQIANLDLYFVDFDYIPQYKMQVVAGRAFSRDFGTDTTKAMVLNEAAVKLLGYPNAAAAIGRKFQQWGREGQIIGVVKNFHFRSLQEPIKPLSIRMEPDASNLLSVQVSPANLPQTLAAIESKWKTLIPKRPYSYYFLDEFFDRQYRGEERFGRLFLNFSILAIFISCLGLLGLAAYSTAQRTKEIGIRKVLGANTGNILNLLSRDFMRLVFLSFFIAVPVAGYFMYGWLQDFAYRTDMSWWIFLLAGVIALFIAFATISFQAAKAALTNPVKSLRTE
jgi:putative ABC transport system permease protein